LPFPCLSASQELSGKKLGQIVTSGEVHNVVSLMFALAAGVAARRIQPDGREGAKGDGECGE
jgi:hypothetical protein